MLLSKVLSMQMMWFIVLSPYLSFWYYNTTSLGICQEFFYKKNCYFFNKDRRSPYRKAPLLLYHKQCSLSMFFFCNYYNSNSNTIIILMYYYYYCIQFIVYLLFCLIVYSQLCVLCQLIGLTCISTLFCRALLSISLIAQLFDDTLLLLSLLNFLVL